MKKKDLTGAVASVKMDDTPLSTISTVSHALAGKAAGLQVNTVSAQPGGVQHFVFVELLRPVQVMIR